MKPKDVLLGLCVAALLVGEICLYSANRQKNAAREEARSAKQQVEQLRAALDQLKASGSDEQNAEIARLHGENQDLPRLRDEIGQLRDTNQQLAGQISQLRDSNQQLAQQINGLRDANDQLTLQVGADEATLKRLREQLSQSRQSATAEAQRNACVNNLRQIDAAKQQWALENNKTGNAVPTVQDLLPYLGGVFPVCPSGGVYSINPIGYPPTCSYPGHELLLAQPQQ